MKRNINKATAIVAVMIASIIVSTAMCGCFFGGNLKDSGIVKERLDRRGFNTFEWNHQSDDWQKDFTLSTYGLTDSTNVENVLYGINTQTYTKESDGGFAVWLTMIFIAYCADEQSAQTVCDNAKYAVGSLYEVFGTQGNIAYWGNEYAYKVATSDNMLWYDNSGTHFD